MEFILFSFKLQEYFILLFDHILWCTQNLQFWFQINKVQAEKMLGDNCIKMGARNTVSALLAVYEQVCYTYIQYHTEMKYDY